MNVSIPYGNYFVFRRPFRVRVKKEQVLFQFPTGIILFLDAGCAWRTDGKPACWFQFPTGIILFLDLDARITGKFG